MKLIRFIILASLFASCSKMDQYKEYYHGGEIPYTGKADSIKIHPGYNRLLITFLLVADPKITRTKIYWNVGKDSAEISVTRTSGVDTIKYMVENLEEKYYTFTFITYDKAGNKSVPATATGKPYGAKYEKTLFNRKIDGADYSATDNQLTINWGTADTVNLGTKIWYTDQDGNEGSMVVDSSVYSTSIPWKLGTKIYYQSMYRPSFMAIDTFRTVARDSLTNISLPVPKDNWAKVDLANDASTDAYGTDLSWIWDGKPGDYPEIYHTDGAGLPHHFTFDLGGEYALTQMEETGRVSDQSYHNPIRFEVWGIADLTGAETGSPANSPGWKPEMLGRGWTLLKEVNRSDNGMAAVKVNLLPNLPKVRYIRIRILQTIDNSEDSHMSEVSFWYKP